MREVLCGAFEKFEGELAGKFYDLGALSEEDSQMLQENGFLFQIPKTTNLLWHAGAAKNWPTVSKDRLHNHGIIRKVNVAVEVYHDVERVAYSWLLITSGAKAPFS